MLKHQLKATFLMQKHQMHWRHEKEGEQLRKYQQRKLGDCERDLDNRRKLLPKVCRAALTYALCMHQRTTTITTRPSAPMLPIAARSTRRLLR